MINSWMEKYIGLPFDQYNCWQLMCKIYSEQFKINLPYLDDEYIDSLDAKNIKKIYEREMENMRWKPVKNPQAADFIVLRVKNQPWHVGMVVSKNRMLHTEHRINAVVERFDTAMWKNNIIGFFRYDG